MKYYKNGEVIKFIHNGKNSPHNGTCILDNNCFVAGEYKTYEEYLAFQFINNLSYYHSTGFFNLIEGDEVCCRIFDCFGNQMHFNIKPAILRDATTMYSDNLYEFHRKREELINVVSNEA